MYAPELPEASPVEAPVDVSSSGDLSPSIESARSLHRRASHNRTASTRRQQSRREDELLDTLWRTRSHWS